MIKFDVEAVGKIAFWLIFLSPSSFIQICKTVVKVAQNRRVALDNSIQIWKRKNRRRSNKCRPYGCNRGTLPLCGVMRKLTYYLRIIIKFIFTRRRRSNYLLLPKCEALWYITWRALGFINYKIWSQILEVSWKIPFG